MSHTATPTTDHLPSHQLGQVPITLPAMRLVHAPRTARRMASLTLWLVAAMPFLLLLIPWQQALTASGNVVAYDPAQRQQVLEAPVEGRVVTWHKREGERCKGPVLAKRVVLKPEDVVVVVDAPRPLTPGEKLLVRVLDGHDREAEEERTVREGDSLVWEDRVVEPGDLIVSIRDANPNLVYDLEQERRAVESRLVQVEDRVASLTQGIASLKESRISAIKAAENRLDMAHKRVKQAEEVVKSSEAIRVAADENYSIQARLFERTLAAKIDVITAEQRKLSAQADYQRALQAELAARDEVLALGADLERIRNDRNAAIQAAEALRQQAEADAFAARRDLVQVKVRQRRQRAQDVYAPTDGTVFRVLANAQTGGTYVKMGDPLCVIVPDIPEKSRRMVELFVENNDVPLITELWRTLEAETPDDGPPPSIPVRLQFEGWPAIQFVGWPSVAVGTFGGRVVFVDAHADAKGRFRILVEPDPVEELTNPWPSEFSLRQGNRASGWVLLNRVTLGWEFWRRLNGFPPVVASQEPDDKGKTPKPPLPK